MICSDIHTHTTYCDGKSTIEEMVQKAVEMGFRSIGISGHCYVPGSDYGMTPESTKKYAEEILALREKYPQIDILLGIERDMYFKPDDIEFDYAIGSLHFVEREGKLLDVDCLPTFEENVEKYFGGNYRKFVEEYYANVAEVIKKTNADVVGHFDLVAKFNEGNKYFDEDADWYKKCVSDALADVCKTKPVFEVNTGAISRGFNKIYPSEFILKEIKKAGCDVVVTSDCHNAESLGCAFDKAVERVKNCGFDKVVVLTKNGFEYVNI